MEWVPALLALAFLAVWCYGVVWITDPANRLKAYTRPSKWRAMHSGDPYDGFSFGALHIVRGLFLGFAAGFAVTIFVRGIDIYGALTGAALGFTLGAFRFFGPTKDAVALAATEYDEWYKTQQTESTR